MGALEDVSASVAEVAGRVAPAVVSIGGGWRGGSGVVIGPGLVLTNAHNVRDGDVAIAFSDGRTVNGSVKGIDPDGDIAIIAVDTGDVSAPAWAARPQTSIGSVVLAVSGTRHGPRVTLGMVSSSARSFRGPRGRRISGSIEHTAPMAPGSSGSALVDAQGQLIGLNTNRIGEGFYLAIPTDDSLRSRADSLARGESAERPQLGVSVAPGHVARRMRQAVGLPERDGLLVRDVDRSGPAATAGIVSGDLMVEAAGRQLRTVDDLFDALGSAPSGDPLELKLVRGTDERTITIAFGGGADRSSEPDQPVH